MGGQHRLSFGPQPISPRASAGTPAALTAAMSPAPSPQVSLVSPGTAGLLLGRVDEVEQRVEVDGTEEEKEDLLPKLVGLRKVLNDFHRYRR